VRGKLKKGTLNFARFCLYKSDTRTDVAGVVSMLGSHTKLAEMHRGKFSEKICDSSLKGTRSRIANSRVW
jgi:hypothetical protein